MANPKAEAILFCRKYKINNYKVNQDGLIDVVGDVNLKEFKGTTLPVKFGIVSGSFTCGYTIEQVIVNGYTKEKITKSNLTSLKGMPQSVGGKNDMQDVTSGFNCCYTNITSLEGAPQTVHGNFSCHHTNITSLEGAPQAVGGHFYAGGLNISSLQGAPKTVGGRFSCGGSNITSITGHPTTILGDFILTDTLITDTGILDLLYIKGLQKIQFYRGGMVDQIMNNSLNTDRDPIDVQDKLIDAEFTKIARFQRGKP